MPAPPRVEAGAGPHFAIVELRDRLRVSGELASSYEAVARCSTTSSCRTLKAFQAANGLARTGRRRPAASVAALNVPAADRLGESSSR